MPEINFIPQFDNTTEKQFSQLDLKNMYLTSLGPQPVATEAGTTTRSKSYLVSSPGLSLYHDFSGDSVRALYAFRGSWYAVVDATFYHVSSNGTVTNRGTLLTSQGLVSIIAGSAGETSAMMITDGTAAYTYNISTFVFAQITDIDFPVPAPGRLTYLNGYACFTTEDTNSLHVMDLNDFASYTAGMQTGFTDSGYLMEGCEACNGELYVFTGNRCGVYVNTGTFTFPFELRTNVLIGIGLTSKHTLTSANNGLIWLGTNEYGAIGIYTLDGYTPKLLSSESFNTLVKTYDYRNAFAYIFSERGHYFYHITFPANQVSFRLDLKNGLMHKVTGRTAQGTAGRHISNCYISYGSADASTASINLIGDYTSGKVYQMSQSFYDDAGLAIEREVTTIPIDSELERLPITRIVLDMEVGTGLTTGQGEDPQIMFSQSRDGGRTFSAERFKSIGKKGKYETFVTFDRLGIGRRRVFKFRCTDPVQLSLFRLLGRY